MRRKYATDTEAKAADKILQRERYRRYCARHTEYAAKRRAADPRGCLWRSARWRAKKAGIPFDIEVSDIVIPEVCPVLGVPMRRNNSGNRVTNPESPTLDRLIPSRGYVKGNIAVISHRANAIKSDACTSEVMRVASWMAMNVPE
jgi:hypothetical protein